MPKSPSYHEAAIAYNETIAKCAEDLAPTLGDPEVQRWSTAVGKQHRFHAKRHQAALEKMLSREAEVVEVEQVPDGLDVPETPEITSEKSPATFSDGCEGTHQPLKNENCEFNPNKVAFSG